MLLPRRWSQEWSLLVSEPFQSALKLWSRPTKLPFHSPVGTASLDVSLELLRESDML
ncbi:unnamed protein product [Symbiodinium sp. CCMP2592]|nr:unnamed protein product [Symbiodinium sp. CCMP2592]